jgi:hypothetical protein
MADLEIWREDAAAQIKTRKPGSIHLSLLNRLERRIKRSTEVYLCKSCRTSKHFFTLGIVGQIALSIFVGAGRTNAQSQSDQAEAPRAVDSATPKQGLNFTLGTRGLDSLSFNGQLLLRSVESGEVQQWKSVFRAALDALLPHASPPVTTANKQTNSIELAYPWGRVSCAYGKQGNRLAMRVEVTNTASQELDELSLCLMQLNFPSVPNGTTLEAGMFGFGFKALLHPLYQYPCVVDPQFALPIVHMDFETGALNFCSDDFECSVSVPYTTNPPTRTRYPLLIICRGIKPGVTKTFNVSLRFGPAGSTVQDLSRDVLESYAKRYPFQVKWPDRRPIGAIFLASSGIKVATNPRRWIMNSGRIDITTDQGKSVFREALLKMADNSINVLKDANAQGMITWDPEGQEFLQSTYYGDSRLTPTLAPEMEFKREGTVAAIDEYFARFRAAGLKVGICIRPQQIVMVDGKPMQQAADDKHAEQILKEKIAYAKRRWGCTFFYVDSTATVGGSINPDVFKAVGEAYPDVLLIPENESMRYFAYSAPLNSYVHHKVTSTPVGARMVYTKAFSVLMAPDGDRPEDHSALLRAVRSGDILLFNCWYNNAGADKIKKIYAEAGR